MNYIFREIENSWDILIRRIFPLDPRLTRFAIRYVGPFAAISGFLLLLCLIFTIVCKKNKKIVPLVFAALSAVGSVAAAALWFVRYSPDLLGVVPVAFVTISALIMMILCVKAYKSGAQERKERAEKRSEELHEKMEEYKEQAEKLGKQAEEFGKEMGQKGKEKADELGEKLKDASKKSAVGVMKGLVWYFDFSNPGKQIKALALYSCVFEILGSIAAGILYAGSKGMFKHGITSLEPEEVLVSLLIMVGGIAAARIVSLFVYGAGETMENIAANKQNSDAATKDLHEILLKIKKEEE